jgi:short-subunit dehydrogenase
LNHSRFQQIRGTGVTINALHPGFTATGFGKNNGKVMAALVSIFAPLVQGARCLRV